MKTRSLWLAGGLGLTLIAVVMALAFQGAPPAVQAAALAQTEGGFITITVKPGESLATYPRLYGVSGSAILAVNSLKDPNLIYPGQVLVLPVVRTFTPSLTTPFYYTAVSGDSLAAVSRRFELDPGAIARANGVAEVTPGVTYLMPAGPHIYVLKKGDTIGSVAARYGVTEQFILNGNTIPNPGILYAGQEIFIPVILDARPRPIPDLAAPTAVPVDESGATLTPQPTATPASAVPAGFVQITVQPGDTLVTYVKRYGVTARAIIDANPLLRVNPALLLPGQKLLIPTTGTVTATATPTATAVASATPGPTSTPGPTATPNLTPVPSTFIQIVVQAGDSLATYVTRYCVTGSALLAANPKLQANPGLIFPGETLVIPVAASFTPSRTTPFFYVVGATDSLGLIALKFEMTTDTLLRANPGVAFLPGTTVLVPAGPHVVTVQPGEELRQIAARYGTTVEALAVANNLPNPDLIYSGQALFIPTRYNAAPLPFTP